MHLLAQGKKGLSNIELGRRLGISSNAAWRVQHKLMQAMLERDLVTSLAPAGRASRSTTHMSAASGPVRALGAADMETLLSSPQSRRPMTVDRCTPASRSCAGSALAKPNAYAPK